MELDDAALDAELRAQFERGTDKLTIASSPVLYGLAVAHVLPEIDDAGLARLVGAAIDLAVTPRGHQTAVSLDVAAKLAGACGYFYLDGGPSHDQFKSVREAHPDKVVDLDSQICRFSWAKWQHDRVANSGPVTKAPNERSGRNQRQGYASELAKAIRAALRRPEDLRAAMARREGRPGWSPAVQELIGISAAYVADVHIDAHLYVTRTVEPDLLEKMEDATRPWPRAVIGEAGSGKSSLLWSLHKSLEDRSLVVAVLLPATWLMNAVVADPIEAIIEAFEEIRQAEHRPVLLLDTVDLMLHDEGSRQILLRLIDSLTVRGFSAVYSTRPQEAALLSHERLRRHELQPYDDVELDHAVEALARRFCPQETSSDIVGHIRGATARGLPVTEVCRSPLLLRMLFELSTPTEPELGDVDVTSLFEAYWDRRIRRDARSEIAVVLRAHPAEDLARLAGCVGLALLACGLPELAADTLQDVTHAAGPEIAPELIHEGFSVLLERGALVHNGGLVGYFHQTMFEFAAAKGVLATSDPSRIDTLAARTISHGGDLFVGAVLEQTLVLAGKNPLLRQSAQRAAESLVSADSEAVRAIGVVAWAHHPVLLSDTASSLGNAGASSLERAARILPTIATKTPGQTISQLMLIWQATTEPRVRSAVLNALARLALRAPTDVADALDYLDPLAASRDSLDEGTRRSLLGVLKNVAPQARSLVRGTLVAMLGWTGSSVPIELDYLIDQWPDIGDHHLLDEVARTLATEDGINHAAAAGIGRLTAAEWRRSDAWADPAAWRAFLAQATDPDPSAPTFDVESSLCAVGQYMIRSLDDECIAGGLDALLDASNPKVRDIAVQIVLRDIMHSESRSAAMFEVAAKSALSTIGYAAQKKRIDRRQELFLDLFAQAQLPDGILARTMPGQLEFQDWTADDRLLRIAPAAADHDAVAATRFMTALERNPKALSPEQLDVLFSTQAMHMPKSEAVFNVVVAVAAQNSRIANLGKIITSAERRAPRLARHVPQLVAQVRDLLAGDDQARRDGAHLLATLMGVSAIQLPWNELRPILESLDDPQLRDPLIKHLWQQTPAGDVAEQLAYLSQYVEVHPQSSPPVQRSRNDVPLSTAVVCVEALLRILCMRAEPAPRHWPIVRTLGLHELENEDIFVVGPVFVVVCEYLRKLAHTQPRRAGDYLNEYLRQLATGEFYGMTRILWHRELVNTVQLACAAGSGALVTNLVEISARLDDELAEAITTAIAERHYLQVRAQLQELSDRDVTPSLRIHLTELVRHHDRHFGTREFPEILPSGRSLR
ncbi:AAA family ATPase [Kribbella turkmenica]|uniref:AAA family ATPase n=1 Tax=Kribbella turkmenica TaxID=2530375 RepID=A0A4V2YGU3_9ACTN|nr:ATP-binding protein [Kribbella turkmenica]TDD28367.1 AAA family ATPase [Kribbella turkmenica]